MPQPPSDHEDDQHALAQEILESIIRLTEQRDEHALAHSLVEALVDMIPEVRSGFVYLVPDPESGEWVIDQLHTTPDQACEPAGWMVREISRMQVTDGLKAITRDGQTYLLACLHEDTERREGIVLVRPEWSAADLRLAVGMLRVHQNYSRVLFDSERDTLTGLYNRKKLDQKLPELLMARLGGRRQADQDDRADYLAVLDIDRFKRINDDFGHLIGDEVLLIFAGLLASALRDVDWVFRYGGEEFVALVREVSPAKVRDILERIRAKVEGHAFPQVGQVTVSIGYTRIGQQTLPPHVLGEADKALYYAKQHGRNRVCDYHGLVSRGELAAKQPGSGSVDLF